MKSCKTEQEARDEISGILANEYLSEHAPLPLSHPKQCVLINALRSPILTQPAKTISTVKYAFSFLSHQPRNPCFFNEFKRCPQ